MLYYQFPTYGHCSAAISFELSALKPDHLVGHYADGKFLGGVSWWDTLLNKPYDTTPRLDPSI